jgi:hypothetical protein
VNICNRLILIVIAFSIPLVSYSTVYIVTNQASGVTMMDKQVKRAFLGKIKQWKNGVSVDVCLEEANEEERNKFYSSVLGKTPSAYKAYWNRLLFSGKAAPPKTFGSQQELMSFVASKKGAICFTTSTESVPDNVTVLGER